MRPRQSARALMLALLGILALSGMAHSQSVELEFGTLFTFQHQLEAYLIAQAPVLLAEQGPITFWLLPELGLFSDLNLRSVRGYLRAVLLADSKAATLGLEAMIGHYYGAPFSLRLFVRTGL